MRSSSKLRVAWIVPEHPRKLFRLLGVPAWHPNYSLASVWIQSYQTSHYLQDKHYQVTCNVLDPLPDIAIFLRRYSRDDIELARTLKAAGVKLIVDAVVNYFDVREGTSKSVGTATQEQVDNFRTLVDLADQVWAVSPFLQELASQYHASSHFVSDSIDPHHFKGRQHRKSPEGTPLVLGWSGVAAKSEALDEIAPVLIPHIQAKRIRVLVVADKRPNLTFPVDFQRWRYSRFPSSIARCDLCIAPRVVDNDYDRGHSIFKIGVFMAMGVPALAGPVPSYQLLLGDEQAGTICRSKEQWNDALSRYLSQSDLRHNSSQRARERMYPYLTPTVADKMDKLLTALCS